MSKKNLNLDKIKLFDPRRLRGVAEQHRKIFHTRVTEKAKDYQGHGFKKYSESYDKRLSTDFRKKDGSRYAGYQGVQLTTSGTKRNKRQFLLTGKTMDAFHVTKVAKDHYVLSWSGEAAGVVDGNAKRGRNIIDGIPDNEMNRVVGWLGKLVDKEFEKIPDVTRIKV